MRTYSKTNFGVNHQPLYLSFEKHGKPIEYSLNYQNNRQGYWITDNIGNLQKSKEKEITALPGYLETLDNW